MSEQNKSNVTNLEPQVLEQGDIYFFYRPKKDTQEVKGVEDVRRFFMVTAPEEKREEQQNNKSQLLYRLFVIGKKSLPDDLWKYYQMKLVS